MSYLEKLARLGLKTGVGPAPADDDSFYAEEMGRRGYQTQVERLASHMQKQLREHEAAMQGANRIFDELLTEMEKLRTCFQESFAARNVMPEQIYSHVDADRSVGILNILWQTISFTTRGNTKPLAMYRLGRPPVFTGRIVAVHGHFHELNRGLHDDLFPALLHHEIASLHIPADPTAPAIMKIKHLGEEEHYLHQADAARMFLIKTVEVTCGGGFFHETL